MGPIIDSCLGVKSCDTASMKGSIEGGFSLSCRAEKVCQFLARTPGSSISKVHDCCNTAPNGVVPGECYYGGSGMDPSMMTHTFRKSALPDHQLAAPLDLPASLRPLPQPSAVLLRNTLVAIKIMKTYYRAGEMKGDGNDNMASCNILCADYDYFAL